MVRTFDIANGEAREIARAGSLGEASSRLPAGVYTSFRTHGQDGVVRFNAHSRRLEESAVLQGLSGGPDAGLLRAGLGAAVRAAGHPESRVRVTWAPPRLFASIEPFVPPPAELYETGAACVTLPVHRENPHAKDTRFLETAAAAYGALPAGSHEGLLVDRDGALLEGLSSNFFAVREGILHTEEDRALAGVTRTLVLELAGHLLPLARTAVRTEQLGAVTESFITSASRGILPVVRIDAVRIGNGRPGPFTRELQRRFEALVAAEAEPL